MQSNKITYTLPPEKIAKHPPQERGDAKLLVLHKDSGRIEHKRYEDLVEYISAGDLIVRNTTKVIPARLLTKNPHGGTVELLILESHQLTQKPSYTFECIFGGNIYNARRLQLDSMTLTLEKITDHNTVIITAPLLSSELLTQYGHTPIPPYLKREDLPEDKERYQTQFADIPGSVAAPTASLNFTEKLEKQCLEKGIQIADITLHVGRGTFLPVKTDKVEDHVMHKEFYSIPPETIQLLQSAKKNKHSVIALGTTVTRALEHMVTVMPDHDPASISYPFQAEADIFIYPGYSFKVVDKLLTNFHAPHSTVLLLAAAFAGADNLLNAYEDALKMDYKFLSYGDSMLII